MYRSAVEQSPYRGSSNSEYRGEPAQPSSPGDQRPAEFSKGQNWRRRFMPGRDAGDVVTATARQQYAHPVAETSYAPCGDLSLAYQVFGDGPIELVFLGPFVTHIELFWTIPEFKAFFDQLARFCRVVVFDKAGVGLSDPVPHIRTVDDRATEIEAVMDAVGFGRAVVFGMSDGGFASIVFAENT